MTREEKLAAIAKRIHEWTVTVHGWHTIYVQCRYCREVAGTSYRHDEHGRELHPGVVESRDETYVVVTGHVAGCLWSDAQSALSSK